MFRRTLLCTTALVPAIALVGCQAQTASQIASDVKLIASGLTAAMADIKLLPGVPGAAVTQLDFYLATIQAGAAKVASATSVSTASTVQEIAQVVQAIASVALPLVPAGSVIEAAIQAALSLLPAILAAVGVAGASVRTKYQPAQARAILAALR
nr:hypothetical protein [uncultured Rhodopila sp.]